MLWTDPSVSVSVSYGPALGKLCPSAQDWTRRAQAAPLGGIRWPPQGTWHNLTEPFNPHPKPSHHVR